MKLQVVQICPAPPYPRRPNCEAVLSEYCVQRNREWAARQKGLPRRLAEQLRRGIPIENCPAQAKYKINGKYYCRKHGALVALDLVAEDINAKQEDVDGGESSVNGDRV